MAVLIPFPLPATGFALNSKVRVNLEFLVDKFNEFNSGDATWDTVAIGTASSTTGTMVFYNSANAFSITFQAGTTVASHTYTWPTDDPSVTPSLLASNTSGVMSWQQILGTSNQITVTDNANDITFSLPQNIDTAADVTFDTVTAGSSLATGFIAADGQQSTPAYSFGNSATTGMYYVTASTTLALSNQNVTVLRHDGTDLYLQGSTNVKIVGLSDTPLLDLTGAATNPKITLTSTGSVNDQVIIFKDGAETFAIGHDGTAATFSITLGSETLGGSNEIAQFKSTGFQMAAGKTIQILGATSGNVALKAPAVVTSNWGLTFPPDPGAANEVLTTDGSGVTSWTTISGAGGATTALDNLASVQVNDDIIPDTDSLHTLGSSTVLWGEIWSDSFRAGTSGSSGQIYVYPGTALKGATLFTASDNTGNTTTTINTAAQAAARTYTIPDAGTNASFMMTEGAQTVVGAQTFSAAAVFSSTITPTGGFTTSLLSDTDNTDDLGSSTVAWKDLYLDGSIKQGTTACLTMDAIGAVTQPNQPSFLAYNSAVDSNVSGDGTQFTVEFDTEVYDQNADFNNTTDTFTAPITGRYLLTGMVSITGLSSHSYIIVDIVTSNRVYRSVQDASATGISQRNVPFSAIADMDSADTATISLEVVGGAKVADVDGSSTLSTYFSGSLIN